MANRSPNGTAPEGPPTITVGEIPRIYALYRPHEDDEIVARAFDLPDGQAVLVSGGHVVTSDDARRTGRRYARILDAELAAVRQCRCP